MSIKIGLLGVGHLGKIHLKCIREVKELELVGFFDSNPAVAKEVSEKFGLKAFDTLKDMMEKVLFHAE